MLGRFIPDYATIWGHVAALGIQLHLVAGAHSREAMTTSYRRDGFPEVPVTNLPILDPHRNRRDSLWWWQKGLRTVIRDLSPDLVHVAAEPWAIRVINALLATRTSNRTPVVVHGCDNIYRHGALLERVARLSVTRAVLKTIDGFASWNSAGVDLARRYGLALDKPVRIVPAVLPNQNFVPSTLDFRAQFGLSEGSRILGFVGRLVPEKGVEDLIRIIRYPSLEDVRLAVWGEGPLGDQVRRSLQDRGKFFGSIPISRVPDAIRACDLIAVPSRRTATWEEQFGRIILEANFCRVPVVAYASGAIPEVVGPSTELVPEGDVEGLAGRIHSLLVDDVRLSEAAQRGYEWATTRFNPAGMACELVDLWSEVGGAQP